MSCPLCSSKEFKNSVKIDCDILNSAYRKLLLDINDNLLSEEITMKTCLNCDFIYYYGGIPGDEGFYANLNEFKWYYQKNKSEYTFVSQFVNPGSTVLDVGCGEGAFSSYVEAKGGNFFGLEINKKAAQKGKALGRNIVTYSTHDFIIQYGLVDIVTSFQVCEHIEDIKDFILSKICVLKPGGLMFIAVPNEDSFISNTTNAILNFPPHHMSRWTNKVFKNIASIFDLDLMEVYSEPIAQNHKKWFIRANIENFLLGYKPLDNSISRKLVSSLARLIAILVPNSIVKSQLSGHTVIAVFSKK